MMKKQNIVTLLVAAGCLFLPGCSNDLPEDNTQPEEGKEQLLLVKVESVGEVSESAENTRAGGRPYQSITQELTIDRVDVIIITKSQPSEIVYKTTFTGWSDTGNRTSAPYIQGTKQGRQTSIRLTGNELLEDGKEYIMYGVGYHTGTYDDYEPFKGLKVGDYYTDTESVTVTPGEQPAEIFAGAQSLFVENGEVKANPADPSISDTPAIRLRRQLAGLMGYFTKIPAFIVKDGVKKPVISIRLVTPVCNRRMIFGGFRSLYDPNDFNRLKVINGDLPREDFDTCFEGSEKQDAFKVNEDILLSTWFPGPEAGKPFDANGDGILDEQDSNWRLNPELEALGAVKVQPGAIFDSGFWVPMAVSEEQVKNGIPTFQLQLIGEDDRILKSWNMEVRQSEEFSKTRTVVSFNESGIPDVVTEKNPATPLIYNIARNNMYTIGDKGSDQSYGEDEPVDLSKSGVLVMDVNPEWRSLDAIYFN